MRPNDEPKRLRIEIDAVKSVPAVVFGGLHPRHDPPERLTTSREAAEVEAVGAQDGDHVEGSCFTVVP